MFYLILFILSYLNAFGFKYDKTIYIYFNSNLKSKVHLKDIEKSHQEILKFIHQNATSRIRIVYQRTYPQKKMTKKWVYQDRFLKIKTFKLIDTSAPKYLRKFLQTLNPKVSKENLFIIKGHGQAFMGFGEDEILPHKNYSNKLTIQEFRKVLTKSGFIKEKKMDMIFFDSCYMANIEFSYGLIPHVNFLVSSMQKVPLNSFHYFELLNILSSQKSFINRFKDISKSYFTNKKIISYNKSLISIDLTKLNKLILLLEKLSQSYVYGKNNHLDLNTLNNYPLGKTNNKNLIDFYQIIQLMAQTNLVNKKINHIAQKIIDLIGYPNYGYSFTNKQFKISRKTKIKYSNSPFWLVPADQNGNPFYKQIANNDYFYDEFDLNHYLIPFLIKDEIYPAYQFNKTQSKSLDIYSIKIAPFDQYTKQIKYVVINKTLKTISGYPRLLKRVKKDYYLAHTFYKKSPQSPFLVEAHAHGHQFNSAQGYFHGISIFFPNDYESLREYNKKNILFLKRVPWKKLILKIYHQPSLKIF